MHPGILPNTATAGHDIPGVVELARRVLPCPPSTAPVEGIFSVAGQVEKSAKYQLTDATLAMQTTLREVWDMV